MDSASQRMTFLVLLLLAPTSFLLLRCHACEEGDVRLVDGYSNRSGRVEFCHDGEWGTVCDSGWDSDEARVVCRQLGLPTDVTFAHPAFGGGSGEIFLDNVQCSGQEQQLELCDHAGIGVHNCEHFQNVGVICEIGQSDGEQCDYEDSDSELTREDLERFGSCVPFQSGERGSPCDDVYTPGVDYIYLSHQRLGRGLERYIDLVEQYAGLLLVEFEEQCYDPAVQVLCHFYLPPCGNSTMFNPPTSVCIESCDYLRESCSIEWEKVVEYAEENEDWLSPDGLRFIDCSNTGEYLDPLPYCCSDVGLDTPCTEMDGSGELVSDSYCLGSTTSGNLAIIAGSVCAVVAVLLLVVIGVVMCVLIKKRRKTEKVKEEMSEPWSSARSKAPRGQEALVRYHRSGHLLKAPPVVPPRMSQVASGFVCQMNEYKLLIPEKNIHLQDCVGQGEFGIVYRGTLSGWRGKEQELIAVKTLKGVSSTSEINSMVEEILKMSKFDHPNVMRLLGVCIDGGESPYIVMPFMIHGSLLSYLRKHRADLTIANDDDVELVTTAQKKLLSMCLQISKGMSYLTNKRFVHRDLAARNCMIDNNFVIKVSDFGLSEDIYSKNYFRQTKPGEEGGDQVKLPVRWMALESLNDGLFTEKTDVWSFGVTCWEVFSLGKTPYPGVDPFTLIKYLERGERLEKPVNAACSQEIYDIMKECWKEVPDKRPAFSELVTTISTSLEAIAGYLDFTATPLTPAGGVESKHDHLVLTITAADSDGQEQVHSMD